MLTERPGLVSRRALIGGAAGTLLLAAAPVARAADGTTIATTRQGRVRGVLVGGIHRFRGIPYGADTRGRRFMPPEPAASWTGVRDALDYGDRSPQMGPPYARIYNSWLNPQPESENCLVLNVHTPGLRDGAKRPVMVWYHGGGFFIGSAALRYADATRLARRGDVVVVTVNHRLNAYGYLSLGHLLPELADSGNAGTLDTILALRWVRDNIAEFGGDPGNVTIFGQSGGGSKVATLLAAPAAQGLFHKAIVQSSQTLRAAEPPQAEEHTGRVLTALGLKPSEAAALRTMPQTQLSGALDAAGNDYFPVLDGRTLTRHPCDPDAPPLSKNIPLMVGSTKDEARGLMGGADESLFNLTWDTLPARLQPLIGELDAGTCVRRLRELHPSASPSDIFFNAASEASFRGRAHLHAERKHAQGGAPVYRYLFAWESPVDAGRWGASHSIEHAFVFDNVAVSQSMVGATGEHRQLVDAVSGAWIAFARNGAPGWDAFDPSRRMTMVFDEVSRPISDPLREERLLFDGHRTI